MARDTRSRQPRASTGWELCARGAKEALATNTETWTQTLVPQPTQLLERLRVGR